jgi:hypothetical protein
MQHWQQHWTSNEEAIINSRMNDAVRPLAPRSQAADKPSAQYDQIESTGKEKKSS